MAITKWINIENCQVSTCNKVGAIHGEDTVPHPALVTWEAQPASVRENEILGNEVGIEKAFDNHKTS